MDQYLLTMLLVLPIVGAATLWCYSAIFLKKYELERIRDHYRWIALGFALVNFALSLRLAFFDSGSGSRLQFEFHRPWIETLGAHYHVGIDGISIWMVLLTTFLIPVSMLVTWGIPHNVRAYLTTIFLLETGVIGVFVSMDMLLFYLFFELSVIPAGFLIGVWGADRDRRGRAAVKFFIFTVIGSLIMLVAVIGVFYYAGIQSFDIVDLTNRLSTLRAGGREPFPGMWGYWLWLMFSLAFFVKIPLWPLHNWQPDAYVQAPISGSIIFSGVMAKMGAYGLMRFSLPFFPGVSHQLAPYVMALAVIGTIYGALIATVQNDLKRLVAFSSLSHMGLVVLGIFASTELSLQGSIYQMINHGLSTGALFVCVDLIYQRRQTRQMSEFGGVATQMPGYSTAFMIVAFSSCGLPLLSGFVGEILILIGTFTSTVPMAKVFAVIGTTGVVLSAVYILRKMQKVLFGAVTKEENKQLYDLTRRERIALFPMVAMAIIMGVIPMFFLKATKNSATQVQDVMAQKK